MDLDVGHAGDVDDASLQSLQFQLQRHRLKTLTSQDLQVDLAESTIAAKIGSQIELRKMLCKLCISVYCCYAGSTWRSFPKSHDSHRAWHSLRQKVT